MSLILSCSNFFILSRLRHSDPIPRWTLKTGSYFCPVLPIFQQSELACFFFGTVAVVVSIFFGAFLCLSPLLSPFIANVFHHSTQILWSTRFKFNMKVWSVAHTHSLLVAAFYFTLSFRVWFYLIRRQHFTDRFIGNSISIMHYDRRDRWPICSLFDDIKIDWPFRWESEYWLQMMPEGYEDYEDTYIVYISGGWI